MLPNITPIKKAKKILLRMRNKCSMINDHPTDVDECAKKCSLVAKQCALECTNELLDFIYQQMGDTCPYYQYWKEVKHEIENYDMNFFKKPRYTEPLDKDWDDDIYSVEKWNEAVKDGWFNTYDGHGYWVKDGLKSRDEVFSTPQLDATHVVWYNK